VRNRLQRKLLKLGAALLECRGARLLCLHWGVRRLRS
jgi:hypothetical protein